MHIERWLHYKIILFVHQEKNKELHKVYQYYYLSSFFLPFLLVPPEEERVYKNFFSRLQILRTFVFFAFCYRHSFICIYYMLRVCVSLLSDISCLIVYDCISKFKVIVTTNKIKYNIKNQSESNQEITKILILYLILYLKSAKYYLQLLVTRARRVQEFLGPERTRLFNHLWVRVRVYS